MSTDTNPDLDTRMPSDLDAERSVLGALMWDHTIHDTIATIITGADFYQPTHELVYNAITGLIHEGQPADVVTVSNRLLEQGHLDRVGGRLAVNEFYSAAGIPANAPTHARIIRDHALRRRAIDMATRIRQDATQTVDPADMLTRARTLLDQLTTPTTGTTHDAATLLVDIAASIGTRNYTGLNTPWPDLNRDLGGIQPGRLYVVGARPGVGKSLFVQNLAEHWAQHHQLPVLYASCEMPATELGLRMLAHQARINLNALKAGHLSAAEWERLNQIGEQPPYDQGLMDIVDDAIQTADTIRNRAKQLHHTHGRIGMVVVDYLQLLTPPPGGGRDRTREREVAQLSRNFKILAKELDCPVVVVSQLNRALTGRADKKPTMTDLRESGAIEQDADVILLLHQPDPDGDASRVDVEIAKNRDGTRGGTTLIQQGWYARLTTPTTARQETQE